MAERAKECVFCNEVSSNDSNIFYKSSDDLFVARWDLFPATPGHAEVLPVRHIQYFDDLSEEELESLMKTVKAAAEVIRRTNLETVYEKMLARPVNEKAAHLCESALANLRIFKEVPDAFNHGLNDGPAAGQTIPHFHYHLMPRWKGDISDPRGGIRHIFAEKGNYEGK